MSAPPGEDGGAGSEEIVGTGGDDQLAIQGQKALIEERKQRKALERQIAELNAKFGGIDLEEIERLKAERATREEQELLSQQRYDEVINQQKQKHQAELQSANTKAAEFRQRYENTLIEQSVTEAFLEAGGRAGEGEGLGAKAFAKLLLPSIKDQLVVEDGEVIVVDSDGQPRFNTATGKYCTIAELMHECRTSGATAVLFSPIDKASGSGAKGSRIGRIQRQDALAGLTGAARLTKARELGLA